MPIPRILFFFTLAVLFYSCTKHFSNPPPATGASDSSSTSNAVDSPGGMLYIAVVGQFMKVGAGNDSVYWTVPQLNWGSSWENPISFDGNVFYNGNVVSLQCYSSVTGLPVWSFTWSEAVGAPFYRESAFNDSLLFVTSPTYEWQYGFLYCNNKTTGNSLWKQQIDTGYADSNLNVIPLVSGNKVITITRDQNEQKHLTAFSIQNGAPVWSPPVDNSVGSKLLLEEGKIYLGYGPTALCYDASTGQQLWRTDLNVSGTVWAYNFVDSNYLVVVDVLGNGDYQIIQLDKDNGAILKSDNFLIPTTYATNPLSESYPAPLSCCYNKNMLYLSSYYSVDSLDIVAFNMSSMTQQWKVRYASYLEELEPPVLTDKYVLFPAYDRASTNLINVIFLDLNGKLIKKVPIGSNYTDGVVYVEGGVAYQQTHSF
jgi:outer membrane protein assembly factor BamB